MRKRLLAAEIVLCLGAFAGTGALAATGQIYSCVDANGNKLTSDRPIPACNNREQRVLNADGSVRRIVPPTPTADERAEMEAAERRAAIERAAQQDAVRRDRNLLSRFPDEATHQRAREAALDDVRKAVRNSEERLKLLAAERKPLLDEAEFYVDRELPAKLRRALDGNDASVEAQRTLVVNQQAEIVRINKLYDVELERLKRLWAGALPGSMGSLPVVPPARAGAAPAARASGSAKTGQP
ncbi:MAG: DUF4124 domain-containing protein [Rhizobacter sp.]|nr:DUF4124 domain-containing protein [Burkholderiaceae bacterium]MCO5125485.1 DUF4124 domain-containing protein [Rhizobacter sp.]